MSGDPVSAASCEAMFRREIEEADAQHTIYLSVPGLSPEQSWALFAETELLNRAIGSPSINVERIPVRPGVSRRVMTTVEPQPVVYEEEQNQWEEGVWHGVRRFFREGPLAKYVVLFAYHPAADGARVEIAIGGWARTPESRPVAEFFATQGLPGRLQSLVPQLQEVGRLSNPELRPALKPERIDRARLQAAHRTLLASGEDPKAVDCLLGYLAERPDHDLSHMAPLSLADRWRVDRTAVLDLFVRAVRIRLLDPRWSVACPSCRGPKGTTDDLARLTRAIHCEDCNLSFDANPAQNLVLTFTPAPAVRPVAVEWACVSGPARTPHIKAQGFVPPSETLVLRRNAPSLGQRSLRLRCPDLDRQVEIEAAGGLWRLDEAGFTARAAGGPAISIFNATGQRVRVLLEDPRLSEHMLLASQILERPRFRELFAADQWEFLSAMEGAWRQAFGLGGVGPVPPVPAEPYDLVVIGGGPAGEAAALRAAKLGRRVGLVEARRDFGGSSGLSSKAFREAAAKILAWAQTREGERDDEAVRALFGERLAPFQGYVAMVQNQEVLRRLGRAAVDLFRGRASLAEWGHVRVDREEDEAPLHLPARHVVIATGSRAACPPDIPLDQRFILDAAGMRQMDTLPRTLVVAGTGVVALEYATIMAALGVRVTLVHGPHDFLPGFDRELAGALLQQMEANGILVLWDETLRSVAVVPHASPAVTATLASGAVLGCDALLYAEGREANSDGLGCEAAGVAVGRHGRIVVDAGFVTTNPAVSAIGDVIGPPGLASTAAHQGKLTVDRLYGSSRVQSSAPLFPTGLWTMPELATVGLGEEQAREQGIDYVAGYARWRDVPRGILNGDLSGWMKLIVDRRTLRLYGAHIIGESACELIHYGVALMQSGVSIEEVAQSVFAAATFHGMYEAAAEDALAKAEAPKK